MPASFHNETLLLLPGSSVAKALYHSFLQHNHSHIQCPLAASKYSDCLDGNPWVQRFPPSGPALPVSRPQPSSTALHHHLPICGKTSRSCSSSLVQRARETAKQVAEVWDGRSAGLLEMKAWGKKNIQQKSSGTRCPQPMKRTGQSLHDLQSCAQALSHSWLLGELLPRSLTVRLSLSSVDRKTSFIEEKQQSNM